MWDRHILHSKYLIPSHLLPEKLYAIFVVLLMKCPTLLVTGLHPRRKQSTPQVQQGYMPILHSTSRPRSSKTTMTLADAEAMHKPCCIPDKHQVRKMRHCALLTSSSSDTDPNLSNPTSNTFAGAPNHGRHPPPDKCKASAACRSSSSSSADGHTLCERPISLDIPGDHFGGTKYYGGLSDKSDDAEHDALEVQTTHKLSLPCMANVHCSLSTLSQRMSNQDSPCRQFKGSFAHPMCKEGCMWKCFDTAQGTFVCYFLLVISHPLYTRVMCFSWSPRMVIARALARRQAPPDSTPPISHHTCNMHI